MEGFRERVIYYQLRISRIFYTFLTQFSPQFLPHRKKRDKNAAFRYVVPVVSVFVITIIKLLLNNYIGETRPFLLYFFVILLSAGYGGFLSGMVGTVLSALTSSVLFLKINPVHMDYVDVFQLGVFFFEGVAISLFAYILLKERERAEARERELRLSEERFRLSVDGVKDYAIITLNREGVILTWNNGAELLIGYSLSEVVGKHIALFYIEEDVIAKVPWQDLKVASTRGEFNSEGWRIQKNGETFWADSVLTALEDEHGRLRGYSLIVRDMTNRRQQEERKDAFISIASHELKTPLTSIKAYLQILQKVFKTTKDEESQSVRFLGKMESQVNKLTELINDFLDVSRIQSGKLTFQEELLDIDSLVKNVVEDFQQTTETHTITIVGGVKKRLYGDRNRIEQVVINLLSNAIKYSPSATSVKIHLKKEEEVALIQVEDFGVGIPPEEQAHIFERFFRIDRAIERAVPGLGLGLYISYEIVKRHGGEMNVHSEIGKGTLFSFTLPFKRTITAR